MSSYFNLFSHPNKELETHLLNVASISKNILNDLCIKNKTLYTNLSFLIGLSHDFAKSTTFFQNKLFHNIKTKKARHGFLSAVFGYYVVKKHLKNNNYGNIDLDFSSIAFLVILKHHGNLSNIDGNNGELNKIKKNNRIALEQLKDIKSNINNIESLNSFYDKYNISLDDFLNNYEDILDDLQENLEELAYEEEINNYFMIIFFYSILLDADKMDASNTKVFNRVSLPCNMVDVFKEINFNNSAEGINKIREEAYKEVISNINRNDLNNKIYSIDLPTGTGKTLTAFSGALKLREKIKYELNFTPKIIYTLPFLSIIDQTEKVFKDILIQSNKEGSNVLLKHNYLADMNYKVKNEEDIGIDNARILVEGWNSEIIITTFIQLFYSLLTNKNRSLRKFHNMANSIIILDEVQSIPYNYWQIINFILKKLAYEFNSWIILMTATQPLIFSDEEIIPLVENKKYYYNIFNRINYNFNLDNISLEEFNNQIIIEIKNNSNKDFMFILNTVNSSKIVYDSIKNHFLSIGYELKTDKTNGVVYIGEDIELVYLSTNIIPKHRLSRINQIKKSNKRHIIVSTQLVEAGVDISVDIIYRDFAPIDSIIQTAGRCNRNSSNEKGIVNIVSLINEKGRRYSSFVYDSILLEATRSVIKDKKIVSENEFNMDSSLDYYKHLKEYGSNSDSKNLMEIIKQLNLKEIPYNFKLIDNDIEKIDVFVEIDSNANIIWNEFKDIINIKNSIERKNKFLIIKSTFYDYIVSVNIKKLGSTILCKEWLGYIESADLIRKYDIETGFIDSNDENTFII